MTDPVKPPKFKKDFSKPVGEPASQPEGAVVGIAEATDPKVFAEKGYSFTKKKGARRHKKRSHKRKTHRRRR